MRNAKFHFNDDFPQSFVKQRTTIQCLHRNKKTFDARLGGYVLHMYAYKWCNNIQEIVLKMQYVVKIYLYNVKDVYFLRLCPLIYQLFVLVGVDNIYIYIMYIIEVCKSAC